MLSETPHLMLETLDPQVTQAVRSAYADAFSPALLGLVPVLLLAACVALRFRPLPLSTRTGLETIEDEIAAEGP